MPLARPLTVAAQAVVTVLLLTFVFAREQAFAGLVPGPDALDRFAILLRQGGDDIARYAIPAPLESDGIRLMLIGGVLIIGLLVDTLAVTFRSAAPAGLPLLALYSVAAGLSDGGTDWLWFLVAATGYLMLLLAEGRDRLSQWGRVFGGAQRTARGEPSGAIAPVRTGRRIGVVALGIALVVPLGLPAMNGGLLDSVGAGVGGGTGGGGTISAVNPLVSLRDSLNADEDQQILSVRTKTPDVSDLYLRIVSLDDFDGTTWKPSRRSITAIPDGAFPTPIGLGPDVKRTEFDTTISAADWYAQDWLPMPYPPSGVSIRGNWRYEPLGMTLVGDHGQNTRGLTYQVQEPGRAADGGAAGLGGAAAGALEREFTKLPDSLPSVVARTAREVTEGAANPYEQAVKLQDWFAVTGGFEYDTQVQVGSGSQGDRPLPEGQAGLLRALLLRDGGDGPIPGHTGPGRGGLRARFPAGGRLGVGGAAGRARLARAVLRGRGLDPLRADSEPRLDARRTPCRTPGQLGAGRRAPVRRRRPPRPPRAPSASESCTPEQKKLDGGCASESPQAALPTDDDGPKWYAILAWALAGLAALAAPAGTDAVAAADARGTAGGARPQRGRRGAAHAGRLAGADRHRVGLRHRAGRVADPAQGGRPHRPAGRARCRRPRPRCTGWRTRWSRSCTRRDPARRRASRTMSAVRQRV